MIKNKLGLYLSLVILISNLFLFWNVFSEITTFFNIKITFYIISILLLSSFLLLAIIFFKKKDKIIMYVSFFAINFWIMVVFIIITATESGRYPWNTPLIREIEEYSRNKND